MTSGHPVEGEARADGLNENALEAAQLASDVVYAAGNGSASDGDIIPAVVAAYLDALPAVPAPVEGEAREDAERMRGWEWTLERRDGDEPIVATSGTYNSSWPIVVVPKVCAVPVERERKDTPDAVAIEAAAKVKWMREHSHAPSIVSPEDLEQMWLDWRGLQIDSYLLLVEETREEIAAYLAAGDWR